MSRDWVGRPERRSGADRRRKQVRIYWPERRKAQRRAAAELRRKQEPEGDPRRLAGAAREWLSRLGR